MYISLKTFLGNKTDSKKKNHNRVQRTKTVKHIFIYTTHVYTHLNTRAERERSLPVQKNKKDTEQRRAEAYLQVQDIGGFIYLYYNQKKKKTPQPHKMEVEKESPPPYFLPNKTERERENLSPQENCFGFCRMGKQKLIYLSFFSFKVTNVAPPRPLISTVIYILQMMTSKRRIISN